MTFVFTHLLTMYRFAAASPQEQIVFGAAKPSVSNQKVYEWLEFMHNQGIGRVCCLLSQTQLAAYPDLLDTYRQHFGIQQVCWASTTDFTLIDLETLKREILPFLVAADQDNEKVVVHCAGGIGRTGQVLAAWLVYRRGFSNRNAIATVKKTGRNPHEAAFAAALQGKNPFKTIANFDQILHQCRQYS